MHAEQYDESRMTGGREGRSGDLYFLFVEPAFFLGNSSRPTQPTGASRSRLPYSQGLMREERREEDTTLFVTRKEACITLKLY